MDALPRVGDVRFAVIGASSFSGKSFCQYARRHNDAEVLEISRPQFDLNVKDDRIISALDAFRPEYVVNFAALNMVAESWAHWQDYYETNVIGVARLAQALRDRDYLGKFIQVSTPEVYGSTDTFIKEGAPFKPSTPYAVSRAAADFHLEALHRAHGFPVCFTRTVNVYGPGQQPYRIIPKTVLKVLRGEKLKLHGGGASSRSFIHIDDVADAIHDVARIGVLGETYHIATNEQTRIRDLVLMICNHLGVRFEDVVEVDAERTGKDMAYQLDCSKIRDTMGWAPLHDFEVGLARTVEWFKARAADYASDSLEYEHRA